MGKAPRTILARRQHRANQIPNPDAFLKITIWNKYISRYDLWLRRKKHNPHLSGICLIYCNPVKKRNLTVKAVLYWVNALFGAGYI